MKYIHILIVLMFSIGVVAAQDSRVMLIGDTSKAYDSISKNCPGMLLSVVGNSMPKAQEKWKDMLVSIEESAAATGFDINGVKLWLNVFWDNNGTIKHLAYYPKPNSKNIDYDKLAVFFEKFVKSYRIEGVNSDSCFSHYGSAVFPSSQM